MPKVSIILPVYNADTYLKQAMKSLVNQTFQDFEILAINDGSSDKSLEVLNSFSTDPRVRILSNERNSGLSFTLNRGMREATGVYWARMDADDIALPTRLQDQATFLDQNPEISLVGSGMLVFGGKTRRKVMSPESDKMIKAGLLFNSCLPHPTLMLRASHFKTNQLLYDPFFDGAEDYELWTRASNKLKFANIQKLLLKYRIHDHQSSSAFSGLQKSKANSIRLRYLQSLGFTPNDDQQIAYMLICEWPPRPWSRKDVFNIASFLVALKRHFENSTDLDVQWLEREFLIRTTKFYLAVDSSDHRRHLRMANLYHPNLLTLSERLALYFRSKFGNYVIA